MRRLALLVMFSLVVITLTPAATADVVVRTCGSPNSCSEIARVPGPGGDCSVDYMTGGLGKPGTVRSSCVSS